MYKPPSHSPNSNSSTPILLGLASLVAVYNFLMPNFDRVLSHLQAYFANSIKLSDLSLEDGQLLGEVLVNQVKRAKKKGGWRKSAELGKVGVDQVRNCEERSDELQIR